MARLNLIHFLVISIALNLFSLFANSQPLLSKVLPCIEFKNRLCIRCPDLTHLNELQCYETLDGCTEYQYGSASAVCRKQVSAPNSTVTTISTVTVVNSSYFFSQSSTSQSSVSNVAFSSVFVQIAVSEARKDSTFMKCHDYMKKGEYSHFISRSQNPIKSVFQSFNQDFKDFKILYEGSGGNLLMCLIGINTKSSLIVLKSFVTIGRTQIIEDCVDYSSGMECNRCRAGYHLDSNGRGEEFCVLDIPGCVEYVRNVCLRCRGQYLLVENRCVSDCEGLRDSRNLKFYGRYDTSKSDIVRVGEVSRCYYS